MNRTGAQRIADERMRQVVTYGFDSAHDFQHADGALLRAAYCYLMAGFEWHPLDGADMPPFPPSAVWPWPAAAWKPAPDPVGNLAKAGALIAAEMDRVIASG